MVAAHVGMDPDAAFIYGLLHDTDKFVVLNLAHDDRPVPPKAARESVLVRLL